MPKFHDSILIFNILNLSIKVNYKRRFMFGLSHNFINIRLVNFDNCKKKNLSFL